MHRIIIRAFWLALPLALLLSSCGTEPLSSRAFEERTLAMGEAQRLYRYGNDLLRQGRYPEALAAFNSAEQQAYTDELREAARIRRMWLQEVMAAYEVGGTPPPPPVVIRDPTLPPYSADLPSTAPETNPEPDLPPLPPPPPSPGSPDYQAPRSPGSGIRETPLY